MRASLGGGGDSPPATTQGLYEASQALSREALHPDYSLARCIRLQQELIERLFAENQQLRNQLAASTGRQSVPEGRTGYELDPPSIMACEVDDGVVSLSFQPKPSASSQAGVKFVVRSHPDGAIVGEAIASPAVIARLQRGEEYSFTVSAVTAAGEGPASAPSPHVLVPASKPLAPTITKCEQQGTDMLVYYEPGAQTGGCSILRYEVRPSSAADTTTVLVEGLTNPLIIKTGLTAGQEHRVVMVAVTEASASDPSLASPPFFMVPPIKVCVAPCPSTRQDESPFDRPFFEEMILDTVKASGSKAVLSFVASELADVTLVVVKMIDRIPANLAPLLKDFSAPKVGVLVVRMVKSATRRLQLSTQDTMNMGDLLSFHLVLAAGSVWRHDYQHQEVQEMVDFVTK